ncbi:hypothetical protein [Streptomyces sp. A1-5]|uniref:hypothetical protein n=1 Tax=Streptomyces sp. A1-5 TaxID=2738410 RepID=UPI001F1B03C1|nr:hypothetical protein [Streptomyces sp. A1-5]UJB43601.1 hypothetical protein HRD51_24895 [Streptomyces sp. A1-5]
MVPVFPDAEALTLGFLRQHLSHDVQFGTYVPGSYDGARPLVIVRRIGGHMRWPALDIATLDVESWAASRETAHDLAQEVTAALMATRTTGGPFARVNVIAGLTFMVDDLTELSRWITTFQISTRPRGSEHGA